MLGQGSDGISFFTIYCNIDFVHVAYLHKIYANLTADQIAGTDKERLCVSKIRFAAAIDTVIFEMCQFHIAIIFLFYSICPSNCTNGLSFLRFYSHFRDR